MSTHYYISRMRKGIRLASPILLSILGVLGIALQTLLFTSSPVLAASVHRAANTQPPEDVARAGASLVRLLVTYSTPTPTPATIQCTGLGVIINSWASQGANDMNNWVLTDGALVNPDEATCVSATAHPKAKPTSIQIMMSSTYNPQGATFVLSAPVTAALAVHCLQVDACQNGPALFAFATDQTLPFLDLAPASTGSAASSTLGLVKSVTSLTVPAPSNTEAKTVSTYPTTLAQFLTPVETTPPTPPTVNEVGMPAVDTHGLLVGLSLKNAPFLSSQDITTFMTQQIKSPAQRNNLVHDKWKAGIDAFYQGPSHYAEARQDFTAVLTANPQFQGAQTFVQFTNSMTTLPPGSKGTTTDKPGNTIFGLPASLMLLVGGLVILLVVVLAVVIILRRRRQPKATPEFQADWVEAERIATATLEEEMRRQQWAQHQAKRMIAEQKTLTPELAPQAFPQYVTAPLPCPNCQKPIQRGITSCPHCGVSLLAPTDSGPYPRMQFTGPPHTLPGRPNGIENQPTREMSPGLQQLSPSLQQLSPGESRNGLSDPEKTRPAVRQLSNANLGFSVVTRTNVGKKRKHKPNEDSLFAAQGVRDASHAMQQVGLFVVADGMGGHANGQDASQTAIQSIINAILPKLAQSGELSGDAYKQLLTEGVQAANQAVHQRNLDQRADMGTTMTAALVVAPLGSSYAEDDTRPPIAIAYVANVGDSRTYLYRKTQGLRKLTNDHSVVASLVEAGIIRPDDIYTHPKRNQIYRSLGEKPVVEVDVFLYPLDVGDKLLLCSDGLWDMVRDPKIEEVLKSYDPDPNMTGDMLIQAALDGGGEDNVSVIVIHIPDLSRQNAQLGIQLIDKPDPVQLPPM
jgi:serine/threonine protein phosphatase PrpC